MKIIRLLGVASAAFFIASSAFAQNSGSVTNHAFALGKGAGTTGYKSLLCGSAQLAVGQAAADPICRTLTGDVTIDAAGVTAIGAAKVTSAMLRNSVALSVIGRSANSSGVPGDISCVAASDAVLRESGSVLGCGTVATAGIANNAVTDAKIRQGVARSVIGVTGNATANVADIQGTTDQVLRVSGAGTALAFGAIDLSKAAAATGVLQAASHPALTGDISNSAGSLTTAIGANKVLDTMIRQSGALSLIGRSANSTGNVADISAVAASSCAFRESSNTIGCGTLATAAYAANSVTNAKLAQAAAATFKGNPTGSTADPSDFTITGLTLKASPVAGDEIMISDSAASNGFKKTTISALASAGSVASIAGNTGAFTLTYPISNSTNAIVYVGPTQSGQLQFSSATSIKLMPYNGDIIRIQGAVFQIPSSGVDCGNPSSGGVFLNGAGSSSLPASTLEYVYLFNNSGTLACDFSATAYAVDSTAGNVGTYIKSGNASRSLIGMVFTNASSQFDRSVSKINVISWFNRNNIGGEAGLTSTISSSGTNVEVSTTLRIEFLTWGDESVSAGATGEVKNDTVNGSVLSKIGFDGTTPEETLSRFQAYVGTAAGTLAVHIEKNGLSEGHHFMTLVGTGSGGTASWTGGATKGLRCASYIRVRG